jgi:diguanylate cyclase (GGDEF)-like protein
MKSTLFSTLLFALAYAAVGWVALQVTIPPDYVSALFPPAGMALAFILIAGPRAAWGVLVGSFLVQVLATLQAGASPMSWSLLPPAVGAMLQALVGVALMKRFIGAQTTLDTPREIALFIGLVAPLGCLVNASISIPTLLLSGIISPEDALFSWANWWLGDTLGVLLAAPLMLAFLATPRDAWRVRRIPLTVTLVAALVLTGVVFNQVIKNEALRTHHQYEREAANLAGGIERRLASQLDLLFALERFATLSLGFSRDDFTAFTDRLLQRYEGTQNYTWNPLITQQERHSFETNIRFLYHPDFRIRDRVVTAPPGLAPAQQAPEYLPILFVEPRTGNEAVVGLNPLSIPAARAAIDASRSSGEPAATAPFILTQETGEQIGVVIYQTIRQPHFGSEETVGLVSTALRIDDLLASALPSGYGSMSVDHCLLDVTDAPPTRLSGAPDCASQAWYAASPFSTTRSTTFAGRDWEIRLRATPAFMQEHSSRAGWAVVVIGLLTTSVLVAFLLMTTGHNRRIQRLVRLRTAELAETTRDLERQKEALNRAQSIARMGSLEIAPGTATVSCSDGLRQLLTLPVATSFPLQSLLHAIHEEDRSDLHRAVLRLEESPEPIALDCRTIGSLARTVHFVFDSEWHDGAAVLVRATVQDVTVAREREREIQLLAHFDPLTGLPNRTQWMHKANNAINNARRRHDSLAVLFLDLDRFKTINDSLGHHVGDQLLCEVSSLLGEQLRNEDVLARLGGDEFVILLPYIRHPAEAATVARKLLAVLDQPIEINSHELRLSVSIGIALHPADGEDLDTLLKHADTAMYGAKSAGRDNFQFFVAEMNERAIERLKLESGIRRAIENDELRLNYQPQFDGGSRRLLGVEALLRWHHPELGIVGPDRFIPVAEDTGLIAPLGEWVLRQACRQQALWQQARQDDLQVAINISPLQFRRPDFIDNVKRIIAETNANPHLIELEITESALTQSTEELVAKLDELVATGVTLALDDFGTGYSSLAILRKLPIGRLKLDRSFVKDLPGDAEDAAIASAALSMARDLGIEVVAEGVETEAQRSYLLERGCQIMQGYLFAKPLPVETFDATFPAARRAEP